MMNILLVSGPGISLKEPFNSGIEAFIVSLANQLVNAGHAVTVIAEEAEADRKFTLLNPFTAAEPDFFIHPLDKQQLKLSNEQRQFSEMDVSSYDVIHYNMFYPHLLEAGLSFQKASLLTLHSPAEPTRIAAYQKLTQQSDLNFVAISERVKQQWDQALGMDMPLVNNGINMELWPIKGPNKRNYLLWAARINQEKNTAAAISLAKQLQLPLKIAGRITDQQYFDEQVKPHLNSQIEYVGHLKQRELSSLAQNAIAYLATATWQEPFGLAALEMLASGVPIVGFSTAVPPNWSHESIFCTASHDWQDLVELVQKSDAVSPDTCAAFASSMNIEQMTANYIKLYREILLKKDAGQELPLLDLAAEEVLLKHGTAQKASLPEQAHQELPLEDLAAEEVVLKHGTAQKASLPEQAHQELLLENLAAEEALLKQRTAQKASLPKQAHEELPLEDPAAKDLTLKEESTLEVIMKEESSLKVSLPERSAKKEHLQKNTTQQVSLNTYTAQQVLFQDRTAEEQLHSAKAYYR